MTGSWKGRGNQYIQFVRVLYCKLPTNGKQLPAFPLEAILGIEPGPQRWEARVLPLCHRGPDNSPKKHFHTKTLRPVQCTALVQVTGAIALLKKYIRRIVRLILQPLMR